MLERKAREARSLSRPSTGERSESRLGKQLRHVRAMLRQSTRPAVTKHADPCRVRQPPDTASNRAVVVACLRNSLLG